MPRDGGIGCPPTTVRRAEWQVDPSETDSQVEGGGRSRWGDKGLAFPIVYHIIMTNTTTSNAGASHAGAFRSVLAIPA